MSENLKKMQIFGNFGNFCAIVHGIPEILRKIGRHKAAQGARNAAQGRTGGTEGRTRPHKLRKMAELRRQATKRPVRI